MAKLTRQVKAGNVLIGGGAPVSVQSMTNTDTADVEATLSQIRALAIAGADIVRVSVYNEACAKAVRALVDGSRLLFLLVEGIRRKPIKRELEGAIHGAGFVLLMGLMVALTYKDIMQIFVH